MFLAYAVETSVDGEEAETFCGQAEIFGGQAETLGEAGSNELEQDATSTLSTAVVNLECALVSPNGCEQADCSECKRWEVKYNDLKNTIIFL